MAVTIIIPTALRSSTQVGSEVSVEATTLKEALLQLTEANPQLRTMLFDHNGELRRFLNVYVNDEAVPILEALIGNDNVIISNSRLIKEVDTISIVPAIAGG